MTTTLTSAPAIEIQQLLGEAGVSAYVFALTQILSSTELTQEEAVKMPAMVRREILLDKTGNPPRTVARDAVGRVLETLQVVRSAQHLATVVEHNDVA